MSAEHPPQSPGSLEDPAFLRYLLRHLLTARAVEERCILNVRQGIQPKFFSAWGNEAGSVGTAAALQPQDVLVPMHRSLGAHLVRGHSLYEIFLQAFLRGDSQTQGRDTGLHLGAPGTNIIGMISPLGSMNVVSAGIAMAESYLGTDSVTLAYIGDGGSSLGIFHEALNFIGVRKLPTVTVIENNQWAYGTPTDRQFACETLADRGMAYGMPGIRVDGTDLCAVYEATREAVERARRGEGPSLIESVTMRMRGHAEHDSQHYVDPALLEEWDKRDPIKTFLSWLEEGNRLPDLDIDALRSEIADEVLAACDRAQAAPDPEPEVARVGVFAADGDRAAPPDNGSSVGRVAPAGEILAQAEEAARESSNGADEVPIPEPGQEVTYLEAIRECVRWRMRQDPRVLMLGEDVGIMGGAFRVTEGFLGEFGEQRVVDMPIAEGAITGACIGLALRGLRPISEMQFSDFVASTFNELVNNAGTFRYRIGTPVPMVMRLPSAGGVGAGPFHSLNPEAWFAHAAGLKVVIPATVEDAWGLMNTALDEDDPVLFLEQKYLYRRLKGQLPDRDHRTPFGQARVARPGTDLTLVTWGIEVERCLEAAQRVAESEGNGSVEVIDLRSIVPWDRETIADSVRRTSRLVIVHEARRTCGFGAEVAAWASEELFEWLDAPVVRLAAEDVPIPSHKALEREVTPQVDDIESALLRSLAW
ncbi:MAG: dehydrogenase E1 component subunit alpha/beta [Myxococcota bacterium]|nr:dehydrogenase E1 component subunit alpha/beta [Myxococcota bacterium]